MNYSGNFSKHQRQFSSENRPKHSNDNINWVGEFQAKWIKDSIDRDGVSYAEKLGKELADKYNGISSSQIRNVYGEMKRIQMSGFDKEKTAFLLLLPKISYSQVRNDKAGIRTFKKVFDKMHALVETENNFENMMKIMEAILAYHRSFGGKE